MIENQLFINFNSYLTQPIQNKTCPAKSKNPLTTIFSRLSRIFYFQIDIDKLLFKDPFSSTQLSFKRIIPKKTVDISGVWSLNQFGNTRTALSVEISPTNITLCQGSAVYNYTFSTTQRNGLTLKAVKNTCSSKDLIAAVESVKYYRLNRGILDLYDGQINVAVEMVYSEAYDPKKTVFGGAPPPASTGNSQSASTSSGVSASNLAGAWKVSSLFGIPFPSTPYSLTFTKDKISLNGGCNAFTFPYEIDSTTQIITVKEGTSTLKACTQSDDQLFVSGVNKMYKYLFSTTSSEYNLNFYDKTGNAGFKLTMPVPGATKIVAAPVEQSAPFAKSTALLLLLKRRDLPRAITNITPTSLSYSRCNTMTHSIKIDDPKAISGNIVISLLSQTKKACPDSTDQVYIDALNSASSYSYDSQAKTILLKNKEGVDVVALNVT